VSDTDQSELSAAAQHALQHRRYPPELLTQVDRLSADVIANDPWLALFQGRRLCRVHSRFAEATPLIDRALATLRERDDDEGVYWALAEWAVMRYHCEEFEIGLQILAPFLDQPMQPYLHAELLFGVFLCLIGQARVQEAVAAGERALRSLDGEADPWLQHVGRIQLLRNLAAGYHYRGETRRAVAAVRRAAALAESSNDTADMQPWCAYELGLALWRQGDLPAATEAFDAARRLAESWGHDQLWRWAIAGQAHVLRDQNRLDAALAAYQLAGTWGEEAEGPAFIQLRQGRIAEARWSCEAIAAMMQLGRRQDRLDDSLLLLALIDLVQGDAHTALRGFEQASAMYQSAGFAYQHATSELYRAAAAFALHRSASVADGLRNYLRFAAREHVLTCDWWIPELVAPLLSYAVQHGIEPAWAQRIIERRFGAMQSAPEGHVGGTQSAELEIARRVQLSLLPDAPPAMPDLDIAAVVIPAVEVGGDFVSYFTQGARRETGRQRQIGIAVGDISGKGLGAALLLSGTVVALNTVAANGTAPAAVAAALHTAMQPYTSRSQMNIAFCFAQLTQGQDGWSMRAVSAGAIPPLVRRASGKIEWIDTSGFPLGALVTQHYHEVHSELAPGDVLVLLSDGIVEAMNPDRALFGFERLGHTLATVGENQDAHAIVHHVLKIVSEHRAGAEQQDDITLVVVRVLGGASANDQYIKSAHSAE
jgi:tetratricopeptide (TPR) repeat protein